MKAAGFWPVEEKPTSFYFARKDCVNFANFPYILLNGIQTMFSQLAKQSSRQ